MELAKSIGCSFSFPLAAKLKPEARMQSKVEFSLTELLTTPQATRQDLSRELPVLRAPVALLPVTVLAPPTSSKCGCMAQIPSPSMSAEAAEWDVDNSGLEVAATTSKWLTANSGLGLEVGATTLK